MAQRGGFRPGEQHPCLLCLCSSQDRRNTSATGRQAPTTDHVTLPPGPHAADSALCLSGGNRGAGIDFHTLLNSLVVTADSDHGARQRHRFQGSTGRHRPDRRDSTPRGPTRPHSSPGHSTLNTGPAVRHAGRVDEATRSLATVRVEVPRHTPGPHRLRPEGPYVTGPSGERRRSRLPPALLATVRDLFTGHWATLRSKRSELTRSPGTRVGSTVGAQSPEPHPLRSPDQDAA